MSKKSAKRKVVIGVDIGGTKIACALVSNGKIISHIEKMHTPNGKEILAAIGRFYQKFSTSTIISAIGISTAGMVNDNGKIVGSTPNLPGWEGTEVKEILSKKYRLPVVVENDANAAAFAEYQIGSSKGANPLVLVIIGTGVGGGIIINGKLLRGSHFAGGEIGHYPLSFTKHRYCKCGKYDCFEAYAAGVGLLALIKHYMPDSKKAFTTHDIFEMAASKSPKEKNNKLLATRVIEDWHYYIAQGISTLVHTLDPKKIVLSGGLAARVNIEKLTVELEKLVLPALRKYVRKGIVDKSILNNDAGLLGAALLASQHIEVF